MKDLLDYIVKKIVSNPEAVSIEETNDNGSVNLNLAVDPKDMGIIIGKGGQTIRAIRKILTVRAIAENVRVNLQLNEPQGGKPAKDNESETHEEPEPDQASSGIASSPAPDDTG